MILVLALCTETYCGKLRNRFFSPVPSIALMTQTKGNEPWQDTKN